MKIDDQGKLVPDIAESYTVSDDELNYVFKLKNNITFHDGKKLTADDVVFTIEKAQDPELKSPREANWIGVKVEKIDETTVAFTLKQAYAPFLQNTTIGILPKHIWSDATIEEFPFSQYNIKPVGTGPYKVESVSQNDSGLPKEYKLVSFGKYALGKPFITNINIKSYTNEKEIITAYKNGDIESLHSISPKQLPNLDVGKDEILLSPLPRIFGVFLNQNVAGVFVYKEVREALDMSADKKAIIDGVLDGYGQIIDSPVPVKEISNNTNTEDINIRVEKAKELLTKNGWKQNSAGIFEKKDKKGTVRLSFSISTGNAPELKEAAYLLQKQWQLIGANVEVKIFEIGDLNQNIIKPRKYDALLFGEIVGRDMDIYPFWHSSGRLSPGLNIAMYANVKADKLLENIRKTSDEGEKQTYIDSFNKEIKNDIPAIFTYSPYFIYVMPKKVQNVNLGLLTNPGERFVDVHKWYIETNNVWEIFKRN
jgi:peptide/nickel transport system substrate-binding protein